MLDLRYLLRVRGNYCGVLSPIPLGPCCTSEQARPKRAQRNQKKSAEARLTRGGGGPSNPLLLYESRIQHRSAGGSCHKILNRKKSIGIQHHAGKKSTMAVPCWRKDDAKPGDAVGDSCGRGCCRSKGGGRTPDGCGRARRRPGAARASFPTSMRRAHPLLNGGSSGERVWVKTMQCTWIIGLRICFPAGGEILTRQIQRRGGISWWLLSGSCRVPHALSQPTPPTPHYPRTSADTPRHVGRRFGRRNEDRLDS